MNQPSNLMLSETDRLILRSYCQMLDGLSHYLGDSYELVLHSLEDYNHSAIKVINGFHTGRTEGAPITDLALSILEQIQDQKEPCGQMTYFVTNKNGEPMKSTTITIKGEGDRIIGLLCINFYMNVTLADFVKDLCAAEGGSMGQLTTGPKETFSASSTELAEQLVLQIQKEVMEDADISLSNKNKEIIQRLYQKGVYNLKDAVAKTASLLNISKNTVYLHLRNMVQGEERTARAKEG